MRTALSISSMLLVVIMAFGLQSGVFKFGGDAPLPIVPDVNSGRSVRIYSCGANLEPVRFGVKPQRSTIFIDGKMLRYYFEDTGLRVVTIPPGEGTPKLYAFNLPRDPEAPEKLRQLIDSVPVDTAIALASFRTIQPKGQESETMRASITDVLSDIGARTDPTADNLVSWAILSLRRPSGWVPLSEVYSVTKGMSISYNLEDDRTRYDGISSSLRIDHTKRTKLNNLLTQAVGSSEGLKVAQAYVSQVPLQSIIMPLVPEAHAKWRYVKLDQFSSFECSVGIPSDAYPFVPGALCSLVINGEVVATLGLGKDAQSPDQWVNWQVDLSEYSNRWVTMELRAEPLSESLPTFVFWSEPTLLGSPIGAVPTTPFDRLLARLDLNRDGVVGRPEVSEFMQIQDLDKDGFVTAEEAFSKEVISGVDLDGDDRASYAELDNWFDQLTDPPN